MCTTAPLPAYHTKLSAFAKPTTVKQLQSFLGFVNFFRDFIPKLAVILVPLFRILVPLKPQTRKLKSMLSGPLVLAYPQIDRPFILETDASKDCLGAVLKQTQGVNERAIGFASRAMKLAETRYHVHEQELLAIHWACMLWRHL
eukprot:Gregarina_sp_Poly_1__3918@NODE_2173_length_2556_cov_18_595822_g1402_i0_p5_GENE_NODE_2173_length_2556_cov_18_595822_g1402_i0NODE_2173_length_2556_cov_18_595822_g1402_i0_p5_ORF_typecomplete_len144_score5_58RT_RNaseH_2/PF17919_1/2_1e23RT_RNaseH/PF17917_1/3_8e18RVT_thumb/PF06817_14/0_0004_NODE_2173_length_2556_cov_18_595822_g1402_i053484